jgi:hypothetical protein
LAYKISARNTTILDWKYKTPGVDRLLKHKRKLRKLWQETRNPACKTAVIWVTQENGLEKSSWKMGNRVGTLRSHTSSHMVHCKIPHKKVGPKATSAIYSPLVLVFYGTNKTNTIADCLENQFRAHDLCD